MKGLPTNRIKRWPFRKKFAIFMLSKTSKNNKTHDWDYYWKEQQQLFKSRVM
jgi:hypothetical protein